MKTKTVLAMLIALAVGLVGGLALDKVGERETPADDSVAAGFARDMQAHHDQAVEMSWLVRERTDDPPIRSLAYDIARTQARQSGQMAGWLQVWGLTPTGPSEQMVWMGRAGHEDSDNPNGSPTDAGTMPGMASS